jgi:hypothetical protein
MQCVNGHANPEGQQFCGECGAPLTPQPEDALSALTGPVTPPSEASGVTGSNATAPPPPPPPPVVDTEETPSEKKGSKLGWIVVGAIVVLIAVGGIIAAASGGSDDNSPQGSAQRASSNTTIPEETLPPYTSPTTTVPKDTFAMGEKVLYESGASVQVYSYEQGVPSDNSFDQPGAGSEYAVIDVEVCAGATGDAPYNELAFKAQTADNRQYGTQFGSVRDPRLESGTIPTGGGCKRGWVTLEVPIGQRPVNIFFSYGGFAPAKWTVPPA